MLAVNAVWLQDEIHVSAAVKVLIGIDPVSKIYKTFSIV